MRRAKIVATIGPASRDEQILERLIAAGVDVARLNFSHGTHAEHGEVIASIRAISQRMRRSVGILQDLQGPKIRVGELAAPLQLAKGAEVVLFDGNAEAPPQDRPSVPVEFRQLFGAVSKGDHLLLDDGRLTFRVDSVQGDRLVARVLVGGVLTAHKGINLPGVAINIEGLTEKDREDLRFGIQQGVDAVAISFVRSASDVSLATAFVRNEVRGAPPPMLIAKVEKPEAVDDLEGILDAVDGVMVARGDLGIELPPERVPALQKRIIGVANRRQKLVITATQMLESMVLSPLPTRAEASDVANAVFDGTDAVMLSEETASGKYAAESVEMMDRIVREAESHFLEWGRQAATADPESADDVTSIARAARALSTDTDVKAVVCFTMRGHSAWLVSKIRPPVPTVAFTPQLETHRRLAFLWGVQPRLVPSIASVEQLLQLVDASLAGTIDSGDQVVVIFAYPVGAMRDPNMILLHTVGDTKFSSRPGSPA